MTTVIMIIKTNTYKCRFKDKKKRVEETNAHDPSHSHSIFLLDCIYFIIEHDIFFSSTN